MARSVTTVQDLDQYFRRRGAPRVNTARDSAFSLSSKTARTVIGERPTFGVAGDWTVGDQLCSVADALSWLVQDDWLNGEREIDLYVAAGPTPGLVHDGLRLLKASVRSPYTVNVHTETKAGSQDFVLDENPPAVFAANQKDDAWYTKLAKNYQGEPNTLATQLLDAVDHHALCLYPPNVSDKAGTWRIRLGGLEIGSVKMGPNGHEHGTLVIGAEDSDHKAVDAWNKTGPAGPMAFDHTNLADAAQRIQDLITKLTGNNGYLDHGSAEHELEAEILTKQQEVETSDGAKLTPYSVKARAHMVFGSQFPTMWTPNGRPRYLDAFLVDKDKTPFAVELKVSTGEGGRYLRHSLHQALLYAHYLSTAPAAQAFIQSQGLPPGVVKPAIYWRSANRVPPDPPAHALREVARIMGVDVLSPR